MLETGTGYRSMCNGIKLKNILLFSLISSVLLIATGCAGVSSKRVQSVNMLQDYQQGNYQTAATAVETDLANIDPKTGALLPVTPRRANVLMHLEAAELRRLEGNGSRSVEQYDSVESLFKQEDESSIAEKGLEQIGSVLVNDKVASYVPTPPERMLANYYKGLVFWGEGKRNDARIEFNRADERARIAVARYEKDIVKSKKAAKENKNSSVLKNDTVNDGISEHYPNVDEWEVYDSFVNPVVVYTNALLYGAGRGSDIEQANDLLERAYGMTGKKNSVIRSDMRELVRKKSLGKKETNVWVIYEAGLSPSIKENRFDVPIPYDDGVIVLSFALPELVDNRGEFNGNTVYLGNKKLKMEALTSMEKLMRTEFKKRWPAVITRATISAFTKALLQHEAAKKGGAMGNILASVYSIASTKADTRMWELMPRSWKIAKKPLGKNKTLTIPYGNNQKYTVDLMPKQSQIVYIKQPSNEAKPFVSVMEM